MKYSDFNCNFLYKKVKLSSEPDHFCDMSAPSYRIHPKGIIENSGFQ